MMRWSQICPVLIDVFTRCALQPGEAERAMSLDKPWSAAWEERADNNGFVDPEIGHTLSVKITSCVGVGNDELRYQFDEDDDDLYEEVVGQRRFVVNVQSESEEQSDDLWALAVLERIRTRIQRTSSTTRLSAVDVALVEVGPSRDITGTADKRRVSRASMDVTFLASVSEMDPEPVGWIEHVLLTTEFSEGGELLPSPPNVINEAIPPLPEEDP